MIQSHIPALRLPSRRRFLAGAAALGAGTMLTSGGLLAQAPAGRVIDVHHHYFPPALKEAFVKYLTDTKQPPLPPFVANWTPQWTLERMDAAKVNFSVLSIASVPANWLGLDKASMGRLVRNCNEFAAKMVSDHPSRFGLFASIPIPDVEGSLKEIAYALDTMKADGITMATSFGDRWPGHPDFNEVFAELNRRKAIVYFHPYAPNCCGGLMPDVQESWIEYPYDTGRTVTNLLFTGTLNRYPDIKWMFSHGGGAIPYLAGRIKTQSRVVKNLGEVAPKGTDFELQRLYYETANAAYAPTLAALSKYVPMSNILYGSDLPYVSLEQNLEGIRSFGFSPQDLAAIEHGNAERLIPRLKA